MKLILSVGLAAALAASHLPVSSMRPTPFQFVGSRGCVQLPGPNLDRLMYFAVDFATDTSTDGWRAELGIPLVPGSSVSLHTDSVACVAASTSYQAYRAARGRRNQYYDVSLARLGTTGFFFGTAFVERDRNLTEYVIFDSQLRVVSMMDYIS